MQQLDQGTRKANFQIYSFRHIYFFFDILQPVQHKNVYDLSVAKKVTNVTAIQSPVKTIL